ncbi:MAG: 5-dehydro-4-deoxy-D-glucuronate isomerase, partial [Mucilaginibacter polytrichastri]|nr:5-dehydro-4-deoxy-D-glucuronate isomerase [Mucilaginibacter polytrichastri]
ISPMGGSIDFTASKSLRAEYFLERREAGIINVGGSGEIEADGKTYRLDKLDCLYLGRGTREITLKSGSIDDRAEFYVLSAPAHQSYPNTLMKASEATVVDLGEKQTANERTIYKYIHEDGIKSCQLVMGLTRLKSGSTWNTMPAHTHDRRSEVYFYFDVPDEQAVFHLMGQPQETRHLVVRNLEAVISPPWSIHAGCGTTNYSFIWGMAGENQAFADMDGIAVKDLR